MLETPYRSDRLAGLNVKVINENYWYVADKIYPIEREGISHYSNGICYVTELGGIGMNNGKIVLDSKFIEIFKEKKIAIECDEKKEADILCNWMHDNTNWNWKYSGERLAFNSKWTNVACYFYDEGGIKYRKRSEMNHKGDLYDYSDHTILKFKNLIEEGEKTKMTKTTKYEVVKEFDVADLYKAGRKKYGNCSDFQNEFQSLLSHGFCTTIVKWEDITDYMVLMDNLLRLEEMGFIEKIYEFKPFTLELKIKTEDEFRTLWHRLNMAGNGMKEYYEKDTNRSVPDPKKMNETMSMFNQVDREMKRQKNRE